MMPREALFRSHLHHVDTGLWLTQIDGRAILNNELGLLVQIQVREK